MSPYGLEVLVGILFWRLGYNVEVTEPIGDYGVDVVAKKDSEVLAIQVKKYTTGNKVSNRDVQRLLGSMHYPKANRAILVTTSYFTEQAKQQAEGAPIDLWDGEKLKQMVERYVIEEKICQLKDGEIIPSDFYSITYLGTEPVQNTLDIKKKPKDGIGFYLTKKPISKRKIREEHEKMKKEVEEYKKVKKKIQKRYKEFKKLDRIFG